MSWIDESEAFEALVLGSEVGGRCLHREASPEAGKGASCLLFHVGCDKTQILLELY